MSKNQISNNNLAHEFLKNLEIIQKNADLLEKEPDRLGKEYWKKIFNSIFKKYEKKIELSSNPQEKIALIEHLGQIYQFYLINTLCFKNNHWEITINKAKKKNENLGVVYTPKEIIKFIIKWIIKRIIEDPALSIKRLKIADIACGPGQFLFEWYNEENILKRNIDIFLYGYDKDTIAIQIAQLCRQQNLKFLEADSLFDSNLETPNQFDIIVGNPPYIKSSAIDDNYWQKLKVHYKSTYQKFDLSVVFLEKCLNLIKPGGICGLIISNKWLISKYGLKIREMLLTQVQILAIIDLSQLSVFSQVSTYPILFFFKKHPENHSIKNKKSPTGSFWINLFHLKKLSDLSEVLSGKIKGFRIQQKYFYSTPQYAFITNISEKEGKFLSHFWNLPQNSYFFLGDSLSPYTLRKGIHTGNCRQKLIYSNTRDKYDMNPNFKPLITSRQKIERYKISWQGLWINYDNNVFDKTKGDYGSLRDKWIFEACPKIFIKLFGIRLQAAIDFSRYYANNSIIILLRKDQNSTFPKKQKKHFLLNTVFQNIEQEFYFLLGILNSNLISDYYRLIFKHTHVRGNYLQFYINDLSRIPIIILNKNNFKIAQEIARLSKILVKLYENYNENYQLIDEKEKKIEKKVEILYGITS
ncbi:MAG: class I SAM-dependent methyltransferase [Candidatus Lokiarchaeota archaeon]|nr:class I SAM-dependent methyltransferase [Candidatus Harpocratesius repetitus]